VRKYLKKRYFILAGILLTLLVIPLGVFASSTVSLNGGAAVALGAGAQRVNPCDEDVDVRPILSSDGSGSNILGFQYDNVNKAEFVGYDIETRFSNTANQSMLMFTTSSISSENTVVRVLATSSLASWSLGTGASSSEVTVTELSPTSFKVLFTSPSAPIADFGQIVVAEMTRPN
jgi:hypothetical protein